MLIYLLRDSPGSRSQYQSFKRGETKVTTNRSESSEGSWTKRLPYTNLYVEVLTQNRSLLADVEVLTLFSDKTFGHKLLFWV